MRIFINARFLTQPITGVQRFALEICMEIKKMHPSIIFLSPKNILHSEIASVLEVKTFGNLEGHAWEQLELPLYLKANGSPLLLCLANTAPLFYSNQIVTVHDVAFKFNPDWFSKKFSVFYNFLIPRIVKKAKKVLTVSESSKYDLSQAFGLEESKIEVIYNAVSSSLIPTTNSHEVHALKPYIMAVASLDPRKNLERLIEAFYQIDNPELKLLLVGGQNKNFSNIKLQRGHTGSDKVIQLGYISDSHLASLYQSAEAFVYPSMYEGFGLPNIEAMRFGCPVITSDIAACREVCGEAAMYVNPYRVNEIAAGIEQLLANKPLKFELAKLGKTQSSKYSWSESARRLSLLLNTIT